MRIYIGMPSGENQLYDTYLDGILMDYVIEANDTLGKVWTQAPDEYTYTTHSGSVEFRKIEVQKEEPLYLLVSDYNQIYDIRVRCKKEDIGALVAHLLNDLKMLGLI